MSDSLVKPSALDGRSLYSTLSESLRVRRSVEWNQWNPVGKTAIFLLVLFVFAGSQNAVHAHSRVRW